MRRALMRSVSALLAISFTTGCSGSDAESTSGASPQVSTSLPNNDQDISVEGGDIDLLTFDERGWNHPAGFTYRTRTYHGHIVRDDSCLLLETFEGSKRIPVAFPPESSFDAAARQLTVGGERTTLGEPVVVVAGLIDPRPPELIGRASVDRCVEDLPILAVAVRPPWTPSVEEAAAYASNLSATDFARPVGCNRQFHSMTNDGRALLSLTPSDGGHLPPGDYALSEEGITAELHIGDGLLPPECSDFGSPSDVERNVVLLLPVTSGSMHYLQLSENGCAGTTEVTGLIATAQDVEIRIDEVLAIVDPAFACEVG